MVKYGNDEVRFESTSRKKGKCGLGENLLCSRGRKGGRGAKSKRIWNNEIWKVAGKVFRRWKPNGGAEEGENRRH